MKNTYTSPVLDIYTFSPGEGRIHTSAFDGLDIDASELEG